MQEWTEQLKVLKKKKKLRRQEYFDVMKDENVEHEPLFLDVVIDEYGRIENMSREKLWKEAGLQADQLMKSCGDQILRINF
jgi:hypothetical protein